MTDAQMHLERRRFKRIDVNISVDYKVVSLPSEINDIKQQAERATVKSVNLSTGGIQLISDNQLVPEQILRIEFKPGEKAGNIVTFAEVRWVAKDVSLNRYRTGIEFLVLKEEDKAKLEKFIDEN